MPKPICRRAFSCRKPACPACRSHPKPDKAAAIRFRLRQPHTANLHKSCRRKEQRANNTVLLSSAQQKAVRHKVRSEAAEQDPADNEDEDRMRFAAAIRTETADIVRTAADYTEDNRKFADRNTEQTAAGIAAAHKSAEHKSAEHNSAAHMSAARLSCSAALSCLQTRPNFPMHWHTAHKDAENMLPFSNIVRSNTALAAAAMNTKTPAAAAAETAPDPFISEVSSAAF